MKPNVRPAPPARRPDAPAPVAEAQLPPAAAEAGVGAATDAAAGRFAGFAAFAAALGHPANANARASGALQSSPGAWPAVQAEYLRDAASLWNRAMQQVQATATEGVAAAAATLPDRRFAAADWSGHPMTAYLAELYLLNSRTLLALADQVQGDEKARQRVRFAVQQWIDAAAPSNYLALNPEALRLAVESKGDSIAQGIRHLLHDLQQGHLSQTDESVFEVGRNVATTEGSVVFENDVLQLIEYAPLTEQVYERPMLFVPPCINKFYILDLQPENSLIRYTVEQGHRLFVVSWRNADAAMARYTWDQYIADGPVRAIEVVKEITGSESLNTLGFCVGGTILSTALAVLAARGEKPAHSLTLLTTFLDFSDTGVLDLFVDEQSVKLREMTLGPESPGGGALLKGQELASTFSFLRPNDLVWNYVVGNYLKGETPPPFDLLYWNSDSTNLPGPMYCWYLRHTYLENNLMVSDRTTVCGQPVNLRRLDMPAYVYASRDDHIVPWTGAYKNLDVLTGERRFVLGASGHIAGVINPPAKNKRSHWLGADAEFPAESQAWLDGATEQRGSWWPDWSAWLAPHGGTKTAAPKQPGSARHPVIEAAPGRYVRQKAT